MLLQLPFFALFTRWMFRRWGYNYTEMLFASAFISCQQAVIYVLFAALMFWIPGSVPYLNVISSFSMMVLMAWSLKGLFGVSWWSASVKTLVINILSIIVVAVALLLAVFLGTVIALNFGILTWVCRIIANIFPGHLQAWIVILSAALKSVRPMRHAVWGRVCYVKFYLYLPGTFN